MLQCDKLKNTTQIIQKKIRYHDLDAQTNKKKINNFYTPLLTKNNDNNKNRVKITKKKQRMTLILLYMVFYLMKIINII